MGMPPYGMPNMQMHPGMPGPMPMGMPGIPMGMPMGMPMPMPMPFHPPFMPGPGGYPPGVLPASGPKVIQGTTLFYHKISRPTVIVRG